MEPGVGGGVLEPGASKLHMKVLFEPKLAAGQVAERTERKFKSKPSTAVCTISAPYRRLFSVSLHR